MSDQTERPVVIAMDTGGKRSIAEIVADLEARGLVVEQVLESIGIVTGRCAGDPSELAAIPGVVRARAEEAFPAPPKDPDTPQ